VVLPVADRWLGARLRMADAACRQKNRKTVRIAGVPAPVRRARRARRPAQREEGSCANSAQP